MAAAASFVMGSANATAAAAVATGSLSLCFPSAPSLPFSSCSVIAPSSLGLRGTRKAPLALCEGLHAQRQQQLLQRRQRGLLRGSDSLPSLTTQTKRIPRNAARRGATLVVEAQAGRGFGSRKGMAEGKGEGEGSVGADGKGKDAGGRSKGLVGGAPKGLAAASAAANQVACPCGGGEERREYKDCCARYHGGVKEPDALTLMKARYSAFARGVVPYLVRTTHRDNPDLLKPGGSTQLAADCEETCNRLVFKRLEILEWSGDSNDSSAGILPKYPEDAFVSFRVVYAYKHGTTTENQLLVEKSRFLRDGDRWYYREQIPLDTVSEAMWRNGALLAEQSRASADFALPKGVYGRAQPKLRPRSQ